MKIFIAESKKDFIDKFTDAYAMRGQSLDELRKSVGSMTCVRLINPDIQPYPEFSSDDLDEISKYSFEWVNE